MDADEYCREIEGYLCRKNDGHLIRIVGPSFERVAAWAEKGIPLKVAFKGIDRYVGRYYARGPRRRPVRIDFCEADIFDVFDEWRRAVGIMGTASESGAESGAEPGPEPEGARAGRSLPSHIDRVITRLTSCRAGGQVPELLDLQIERTIGELDAARAGARALRGDARRAFVARLDDLDRALLDTAAAVTEPRTLAELGREAERELEPFRDRMPADALRRAVDGATRRLLRDRLDLPSLSFE